MEINFMFDYTHILSNADLNSVIRDLKYRVKTYRYVYLGKIGVKKFLKLFPAYADLFNDFGSKIAYVFAHENSWFKVELVFFKKKYFEYLGDEVRIEISNDNELRRFLEILTA